MQANGTRPGIAKSAAGPRRKWDWIGQEGKKRGPQKTMSASESVSTDRDDI
jgi:hypothetical protein